MEASLNSMKILRKIVWITLLLVNIIALLYVIFVYEGKEKFLMCFMLAAYLITNFINLARNWKEL